MRRSNGEPEPAVLFERLYEDVEVPGRSTELSAGYDVRAYLKGRRVRVIREEGAARGAKATVTVQALVGEGSGPEAAEGEEGSPALLLRPGDRALVPTGFRARLPAGYEGQIRVRSSVAWKKGLVVPNAPGTVDADYPDEWFVLLQNASGSPQRIEHGERIAQIVIARHATLPWREGEVRRSTDRTGGLGSTGR